MKLKSKDFQEGGLIPSERVWIHVGWELSGIRAEFVAPSFFNAHFIQNACESF